MNSFVFPHQLIGQILYICQLFKINVPFRKIVALGRIYASGCWMKIPDFIICHIRPGNKMINRNLIFTKLCISIYLHNRLDCHYLLPILLYIFQLSLLRRIKFLDNTRNIWISPLNVFHQVIFEPTLDNNLIPSDVLTPIFIKMNFGSQPIHLIKFIDQVLVCVDSFDQLLFTNLPVIGLHIKKWSLQTVRNISGQSPFIFYDLWILAIPYKLKKDCFIL